MKSSYSLVGLQGSVIVPAMDSKAPVTVHPVRELRSEISGTRMRDAVAVNAELDTTRVLTDIPSRRLSQ